MKITAIETILVKIPYENGGPKWQSAGRAWTTLDILFVRVDTDEGVTGWGEAFGHAVCAGTKTTLDTMVAPLFIGRDPTDIAGLMHETAQKTHIFGRNGSVQYALSGIDIALWDIAGKRAGLPLHQLLGGSRRSELSAYASLLRYGEPRLVAANAARAAESGYRWVKLHEIDVPQVAAAREAVGPGVPIMLDTNCPWTVAEALAMARRLQPYNLFWLEEPVWPPEDYAGLAEVRKEGVAIASGENVTSLHEFRRLFEQQAVDVVQPSVIKLGGITAMTRVLALAQAFSVRVVPHCFYWGPGYLATAHLAASMAERPPVETPFIRLERSPHALFNPDRATLELPDKPGLGFEPDVAVLDAYRVSRHEIS
jgi:D-galactarolactone cycloisomerase